MTQKQYDVIIIGAGMAGLAAAAELRSKGIENSIILEAQDYIGGRVKTAADWGDPIALGAEFIHGDKTITADIARQLNLEILPSTGSRKLIDKQGSLLSVLQEKNYFEILDYVTENGANGIPISQLIETNPYSQDETVKQLVHFTIGDYEGDETSQLDSGAFSEMIKKSATNGKNIILKDSYPPILEYFAAGLEIQTSNPVKHITRNAESVSVELRSGEVLSAKRVIITVSLGVLKSQTISFTPELPQEKLSAIEHLGMGNAMKLILRFKDSFDVHSLFEIADGENETLQTITCWWSSANNPHVLVGYAGGARAGSALTQSEDELLKQVLDDLSAIAGQSVSEQLVDHKLVRWDTNPFTLGAYTNHPVGTSSKDNRELARPTGQIFWAGEATDAEGNYATVHGAIASGQRAAREIIAEKE